MTAVGMSESQMRGLLDHLNKTWRNKFCPMCGNNDWGVDGVHSVTLQETRGVLNLGGPALPCAAVTCRTCGNTLLINMVIAGIYGADHNA